MQVLSILENLSEIAPSALEAVCERTELISWLLSRLQVCVCVCVCVCVRQRERERERERAHRLALQVCVCVCV